MLWLAAEAPVSIRRSVAAEVDGVSAGTALLMLERLTSKVLPFHVGAIA
jgi:hypothetical protein